MAGERFIPRAAQAATEAIPAIGRELSGEAPGLIQALQNVLTKTKAGAVDPALREVLETIGKIAANPKIQGILSTLRGVVNPADVVQQGTLPYAKNPALFQHMSPQEYSPQIEQSIMELLNQVRPRVGAGELARREGYNVVPQGADQWTGISGAPEIEKTVIPEAQNIWEGLGPLVESLTARQRQIAELLTQGKTQREAASELGLARQTVDTAIRGLRDRLYRSMPEASRQRIQAQVGRPGGRTSRQLEDSILGVQPERAPERSGAPSGMLPEEWNKEQKISDAYRQLYQNRVTPEMPQRMEVPRTPQPSEQMSLYLPQPKPDPSELDVLQRLHGLRSQQDPSYQALEEFLRRGTP